MKNWGKYALALVVTAAIFGTAFYAAARFNAARVADIRAAEDQVSLDLLSNETQYQLLGQLSCSDISENPVLSDQLNDLAGRLSNAEENLGTENPEVVLLKSQYSLLEIRDYLLMEKVRQQCGIHPISILYFYTNAGDCEDCTREGDVLTYLRETYPDLRVYSFDYNIDLAAVRTLIRVYKIKPQFPALVIDTRSPVYGLKSVSDIYSIAPEIQKLATSTATSTQ